MPLPVQGLACRRVLVMDFVPGTPLNKLAEVMAARGIKPGSPESQIAGRRILSQLTEAFGRMMLGAGFIHGDPHPGNIFVREGAKVSLIDCGQVKQISTEYRLRLAQAILLVNEWTEKAPAASEPERQRLLQAARTTMADFGVTFAADAGPEAAAALALLLFADPDVPMPGGFSSAELSATSPIKAIESFPQELVLLGRATILIKVCGSSLFTRLLARAPSRPRSPSRPAPLSCPHARPHPHPHRNRASRSGFSPSP